MRATLLLLAPFVAAAVAQSGSVATGGPFDPSDPVPSQIGLDSEDTDATFGLPVEQPTTTAAAGIGSEVHPTDGGVSSTSTGTHTRSSIDTHTSIDTRFSTDSRTSTDTDTSTGVVPSPLPTESKTGNKNRPDDKDDKDDKAGHKGSHTEVPGSQPSDGAGAAVRAGLAGLLPALGFVVAVL